MQHLDSNQRQAGEPPPSCPDCTARLWPPGSVAHYDGCPAEAATWAQARADLDRLVTSGVETFDRGLTAADAAELAQHLGVWPCGCRERRRYRVRVHRASPRGIFRVISRDDQPIYCNAVVTNPDAAGGSGER